MKPKWLVGCWHVTYYIYRSLDYLSIMLRYSGLFGLCNSPVQGQVITAALVAMQNREAVAGYGLTCYFFIVAKSEFALNSLFKLSPNMGSTNAPLPPRNSTRELKMHGCLIEVTRFSDGQSATFWLGGYLNNETRINTDGTLDPNMLSYDDFEQDLMDHLGFDAYEENLRWDYKSPFPPRASPDGYG
ncbi:hypothetical protein ACN42_g3089 [Penicillium freii]|uniref:Uncharacterized protein n=1 Tax=Penicillium freii TaxID=48697 RepID=A0A117NQH3_PENFR|nr:hypothetical protein ACN42_g3089 [Penicillium freii]